jgi:hypothetical protein
MQPTKHRIDLHMEKVSTGEIRVRSIEVNFDQLQNIRNQLNKQIGDYKLLKLYEVDSTERRK